MLILSRFKNQSFFMFLEDGTKIEVKVLDIFRSNCGKVVKIGINAPQSINIVRKEILGRVRSREIEDELMECDDEEIPYDYDEQ